MILFGLDTFGLDKLAWLWFGILLVLSAGWFHLIGLVKFISNPKRGLSGGEGCSSNSDRYPSEFLVAVLCRQNTPFADGHTFEDKQEDDEILISL